MSPLEMILSKSLLSALFPHTPYFLWPLTVSRLGKKKIKKILVALFRCKISMPSRNQGNCSDCITFHYITGFTHIHLRCTPVTCMLLIYFYMLLVVVGAVLVLLSYGQIPLWRWLVLFWHFGSSMLGLGLNKFLRLAWRDLLLVNSLGKHSWPYDP